MAGVLVGGWEAGGAQQLKTCGEALWSVGREVKSFNWNKADANSFLKAKQMKIIFTAPQLFCGFFSDQA